MAIASNAVIKHKHTHNSFLDWITQYDSFVIFSIGFIAVILTIIITGLFHSGDSVRTNVLFNSLCGLGLAFTTIWLIFKFMGAKITLLGKSFDFGMLVYISVILFIVFIFGN